MRLVYVLILTLCVALASPAAQSPAQSSKGARAKQALTTLTGVVDEKGDEDEKGGEDQDGHLAVHVLLLVSPGRPLVQPASTLLG